MSILKDAIRTNERLEMTLGEQELFLVHIDDVVRAFAQAAVDLLGNTIHGHRRYSIRSQESIKLSELIDMITLKLKYACQVDLGGRPYRNREVMAPWLGGNILPGWNPEISLHAGISEYLGSP